jgi:uncharacterized protein (DUF697 family)
MPKAKSASRLGAIGTARDFFNVIKELSLDEIREDAERLPTLLVLAPDDLTASRIGSLLTGPDAHLRPATAALFAHVSDLDRFDAIVVFDPSNTGRTDELRNGLVRDGRPLPVVRFPGDKPDSARAAARVRASLMTRLPKRAPAFGRAYPAFKDAAVRAVLDETAQVNAQFAFVSNIPSMVPVVGSLFAAGADFFVLTKNQLLMLYKIAAIHGKDLENRKAFFQEMASVVGAAMLWRTVARELTSFLPFAAGTIPKVVIAFAGTIVVGRIADYYYRYGRRPSREEILAFYKQAAEVAKRLPLPKPRSGGANGSKPPAPQVGTGTDRAAETREAS